MRRHIFVGTLIGIALLPGCADELPLSTSGDDVPVDARTVEILLPFEEVATDLQVIGGFGSAVQLGHGLVARAYRDTLDARTLVRFSSFPTSVEVEDTAGTVRDDTDLTFVGGRIVARIDTAGVDGDSILAAHGAPLFRASAITEAWHPLSATWELAVDTVGEHRPWSSPGAGGATPLDTARWEPTESDSVVLEVDSATVAAWADTTDAARGLRLELETPGLRHRLRNVSLAVEVRPSVNPDTTVFAGAERRRITFVYSPLPDPPPGGIRFGGVPAWRTVFRLQLSDTLRGPPELCEALGCPLHLTPDRLSFASLQVRTRRTPSAFQPRDTLRLDVRPVLRPDLLPKSPLGDRLGAPRGRPLAPELFGEEAGRTIDLPLTAFVRSLLRDEGRGGGEAPRTVALLSSLEPSSLGFGEFDGPGSESPPLLRLIVTRAEDVTLP